MNPRGPEGPRAFFPWLKARAVVRAWLPRLVSRFCWVCFRFSRVIKIVVGVLALSPLFVDDVGDQR